MTFRVVSLLIALTMAHSGSIIRAVEPEIARELDEAYVRMEEAYKAKDLKTLFSYYTPDWKFQAKLKLVSDTYLVDGQLFSPGIRGENRKMKNEKFADNEFLVFRFSFFVFLSVSLR